MPSREEVYQNMYGDIEEAISEMSPEELQEELRNRTSDVRTGVTRFKDKSKTESPFTVDVEGPRRTSVARLHEERTPRAQTVDEQQNAPVTLDEEQWIEQKNRYDYPGVDTVPRERLGRRAETAAKWAKERGRVDRVEHKGSAKNLQGKFSPRGSKTYGRDETVVRVQGTASAPERTLAHEMGHAFDWSYGSPGGHTLSNELFQEASDDERDALIDEARSISTYARGDFEGQERYRNEYAELTADVVGQAILDPRATRREAPKLYDRLEDLAGREGWSDVFGDESDPLGVL